MDRKVDGILKSKNLFKHLIRTPERSGAIVRSLYALQPRTTNSKGSFTVSGMDKTAETGGGGLLQPSWS